VEDLTSTLDIDKSTVWVDNQTISQPAGSYTDLNFTASYAGYVSVNVQTSTTNTTYVEVIYSAYLGINYDNTITVGTSGTAAFPVLPFLIGPPFKPFVITPSNFTFLSNVTLPSNSLPLQVTVTLITIQNIEIRVGNTNTVGNATETVTITYHY
jgi:hypothetical protein